MALRHLCENIAYSHYIDAAPWLSELMYEVIVQKFLIAGMPRSGSTLVATTLAQHMNIVIHGELFHPVTSERAGSHSIKKSEGKIRFFDPKIENYIDFLKNEIWNRKFADKAAVGFKLFGEYVSSYDDRELFSTIIENFPDLKFIIIWRENLLDCLISRKVAESSGIWMKYSNDISKDNLARKISIDPDFAIKFFENYSQIKFFLANISRNTKCFILDYEDFVSRFDTKSDEMFEFLGVNPAPVSMAIKKQASHRQSDYVENWNALRARFNNTPFSSYFRD